MSPPPSSKVDLQKQRSIFGQLLAKLCVQTTDDQTGLKTLSLLFPGLPDKVRYLMSDLGVKRKTIVGGVRPTTAS